MKKLTQTFFFLGICISVFAGPLPCGHKARLSAVLNRVQTPVILMGAKATGSVCVKDSTISKGWYMQDNKWLDQYKSVYSYDSHLNNVQELMYNYDAFNFSWAINARKILAYDSHNNRISYLYQYWSPVSSGFLNSFSNTYAYNTNNQCVVEENKNWNSQAGAWEINSRTSYTYTGNNPNPTLFIIQNLNTGTQVLENSEKISIVYDIFNNIVSALLMTWNPNTSTWEKDSRVTVTNSGTKPTQYLYEDWNPASNLYEKSEKDVFSYDGDGNQISLLIQLWDNSLQTWENDSRTTDAFDNKHNRLSSLYEEWDTGTNNWESLSQDIYTYDINNNQISQLFQNRSNNTWVNSNSNLMYYNCTTVDIKEIASASKAFSVYPNPAQSTLFINSETDFKTVQILNLSGQLVMNKEHNTTVEISGLEKGIYLIQLQDKNDNPFARQKFVKE